MNAETYIINTNTCRACLSSKELCTQFLFCEKFHEMFQICTSIEVREDDGLPSLLCSSCITRLESAFSFRELCTKSDIFLKTQVVSVKAETLKLEEYDCSNFDRDSISSTDDDTLNKERQNKSKRKNKLPIKRKSKKISDRYPLKCTKCPSFFVSQERYDGHLREHEGKKPAVCKVCGKTYNKWHGLLQHMVLHTGEKKFICHCGKDFYYNGAYKVHLKTHGGDEVKTFVCDECGKGFRTNAELKHHKFSHTDETPLQCPQCPKSFKNNQCLRAHLQRHAKIKNHICSTCGKATVTPAELRIHMRTHTDQKPFSCELCNKNFRVRSALRSHMLSHSGIRNYKCNICSKMFMSSGSLKTHHAVHTGEKPYRCEVCERCFSQRSSLKTHIKVHSKENAEIQKY